MEIPDFVMTLVASGFGAWLSVRYLPISAKKAEYQWKKRLESEQQAASLLCKIDFLSHHYLASEYADKFSVSGKGLKETQLEVIASIREFHMNVFEWVPHLDKKYNKAIRAFLSASQLVLDKYRESYAHTEIIDQDDVDLLYQDLLLAISKSVGECLSMLDKKWIRMYEELG